MSRLHHRALLIVLVGVAALLRVILAVGSPTPYGYVYDFYHEAVQLLYSTGRLPSSTDCWQCYHPPLFTFAALPIYALGRALSTAPDTLTDPALRFVAPIALVCGGVVTYYGYRTLRHFRFTGTELVVGTALMLALPCLFISSYGIEADILLNALMAAFLYYLLRFMQIRRATRVADASIVGVLAGLACATKYSGLLAPTILVVTVTARLPFTRQRWHLVSGMLVALAICIVIGSWKYVDNIRHHRTPLFANGSAQQGFSIAERPLFLDKYEFHTLRFAELRRLTWGELPPGLLTDLPIYRSVWTTLHAMAWGDMSFFSDTSRHEADVPPYPRKNINPILAFSVLLLGIIPTVLALQGFVATIGHSAVRPLAIASGLTLVAYFAWVIAQERWALKTKYILYLLPAYVAFALYGVRSLRRLSPRSARIAKGLLVLLVVMAHLYLLDFAWS
jgi:4-amino-4-deoxy-L-arabinose transferase-like glycosyltransferase